MTVLSRRCDRCELTQACVTQAVGAQLALEMRSVLSNVEGIADRPPRRDCVVYWRAAFDWMAQAPWQDVSTGARTHANCCFRLDRDRHLLSCSSLLRVASGRIDEHLEFALGQTNCRRCRLELADSIRFSCAVRRFERARIAHDDSVGARGAASAGIVRGLCRR